jgi:hypothetical protein
VGKVCVFVFSCESVVIMRCAERKGTAMMLWKHEFFMVVEPAPRGPPKPYVYQALEFRLGVHLPEDEVERMVRNQQKEVWVCVCNT